MGRTGCTARHCAVWPLSAPNLCSIASQHGRIHCASPGASEQPSLTSIRGGKMFAKWLRSMAKWPRPSRGSLRKGWRSALFFQPSFELLEDRLVPTTLSIPTTLIATQGGVVAVPIMVDSLKDAAHGNTGL